MFSLLDACYLTVSWDLDASVLVSHPYRFGSNLQGEVLRRRSVRSKSPPGINDFFTYLAPLDLIACALPDDKGVVYKDARKM